LHHRVQHVKLTPSFYLNLSSLMLGSDFSSGIRDERPAGGYSGHGPDRSLSSHSINLFSPEHDSLPIFGNKTAAEN